MEQRQLSGVRKINNSYAEVSYKNNLLDMNNPGSLIRIASFTTARARTKLINAMNIIG